MTKYKLTISDVQKLCSTHGVPYLKTTKLYYKKFAYNLTLKHVNIWQHMAGRSFSSNDQEMNDIRAIHHGLIHTYAAFGKLLEKKGIEFRTRRELNYNIYFDDPVVFRLALRQLSQNILELNGPAHDQHLEKMRHNRKILVRDRLWYKHYRYKITYRGTSDFQENTIPRILEFKKQCEDTEIKLSSNIYTAIRQSTTKYSQYSRWRRVQPWHTCSVYLNNEDTLVYYKMMVPGESDYEHEIILLSELETDK